MTTTMTSTGDATGRGFAARIRTETRTAHQEAERAPFVQDLLGGRLPVDDYVRLVVQHHALYSVLEALVAGSADPVVARFAAPELERLPAIVADLEFLAGPDWGARFPVLAATEAYGAHLREVAAAWPGGLVAHHYVRYLGDLSGGQLIGRVLQRVYRFEDQRGTAFYRFPGIASPKAFKARYRAQLDALGWVEPDRRRFVDEVNEAYRLNTDVFYELAPLPVYASRRVAAAPPAAAG